MKWSLVLPLLLCAGCARFVTSQTDTSYAKEGTPERAITTKASAYTLFSAKSTLSTFKATQTDKTQSATVGGLEQQASEPTNTLNTLEAVVGAAVRTAVQLSTPPK